MNFLEIILTDFYPFFFSFQLSSIFFPSFERIEKNFAHPRVWKLFYEFLFDTLSANFSIEFLEIILEMRKGKT